MGLSTFGELGPGSDQRTQERGASPFAAHFELSGESSSELAVVSVKNQLVPLLKSYSKNHIETPVHRIETIKEEKFEEAGSKRQLTGSSSQASIKASYGFS